MSVGSLIEVPMLLVVQKFVSTHTQTEHVTLRFAYVGEYPPETISQC